MKYDHRVKLCQFDQSLFSGGDLIFISSKGKILENFVEDLRFLFGVD